jgi:hypothetical protein
LRGNDPLVCTLESFGAAQQWQVDARDKDNIIITDKNSGRVWQLSCKEDVWTLKQ